MDYSYSTGSDPNITYNSVGTAWGMLTTPGATGDKTVSVDGNYYWAGILIALRPQLYYTVPPGVYSLQVEVWGGGGRGGSCTTNGVGGGGGGGASLGSANFCISTETVTSFFFLNVLTLAIT